MFLRRAAAAKLRDRYLRVQRRAALNASARRRLRWPAVSARRTSNANPAGATPRLRYPRSCTRQLPAPISVAASTLTISTSPAAAECQAEGRCPAARQSRMPSGRIASMNDSNSSSCRSMTSDLPASRTRLRSGSHCRIGWSSPSPGPTEWHEFAEQTEPSPGAGRPLSHFRW